MTDNKTLILTEFEELKGQFVITDSWRIERLVAIGQDEWDYYWITYDGRKFKWNTCVGKVVPLKGYLRDRDYEEFLRLARLNHFDQAECWVNTNPSEAEDFCRKHKNEVSQLEKNHEFLTDIHWEMI
jgi:hypothetical protein